MRGGGLREQFEGGGGYAGEGIEDKMQGVMRKKMRGGECRRGERRQNAGGGGLREKFEGGGMPESLKKMKYGRGGGLRVKI